MASIYKPVGGSGKPSRFWHAAFYMPAADGRAVLVRKSTGFTDRKKALAAAVEMERAGRMAGERGLTEMRARDAVSRVMELATGQRMTEHTLEGWLQTWLDIKRANATAGTLERYKGAVEKFLASLGESRRMGLEQLTTGELVAFQQRERKRGKTAQTVNLDLKIVAQGIRAAHRRGLMRDNPAAAVEPLRDDGEGSRQPFTAEELQAILSVAEGEGEWKGVIMVALYTGARLTDVVRMKWGAVDLAERIIRLRPQKTARSKKSRELVIPILPPLEAWLMAQSVPDKAEAPLFPALSEKSAGGAHGLSASFRRILDKAGIAPGVARAKEGKAGRNLTAKSFHSLRHTFNSWLANAGVPQEIRQRILGHASGRMNDGYTHLSPATLHAALAEVPVGALH
jgi:integrase